MRDAVEGGAEAWSAGCGRGVLQPPGGPRQTAAARARPTKEDFSGSGSDSGSSGKKTPERERLLDRLHVDPSVRFGRFHREHGTFAQKYAMRDEDILGTGMSGGVCLAFSRTSGVQAAVGRLRGALAQIRTTT